MDRAFSLFVVVFVCALVLAIYFFAATHGVIPTITRCNNPNTLQLAESIKDVGKWKADEYHLTRASDGLSIWHANNVYGLGVNPNGYAIPDDGGLSLACRSLIYRTIKPRLPRSPYA